MQTTDYFSHIVWEVLLQQASFLDIKHPRTFSKMDVRNPIVGLDGTICLINDVLICEKDEKEHHDYLTAALERTEKAGAMLNPEKCEFAKTEIKFLSHLITQGRI